MNTIKVTVFFFSSTFRKIAINYVTFTFVEMCSAAVGAAAATDVLVAAAVEAAVGIVVAYILFAVVVNYFTLVASFSFSAALFLWFIFCFH